MKGTITQHQLMIALILIAVIFIVAIICIFAASAIVPMMTRFE